MKFNDEWPSLEKWFDQLSVLKQVDAAAGHNDVADVVENIIQQCIAKDMPQVHSCTLTHTHTCTLVAYLLSALFTDCSVVTVLL